MTPNYNLIPEGTRESIDAYVQRGQPPGSFVLAILTNDLKEACARADEPNIAGLWHTVSYCYSQIPYSCWGSRDKVNRWMDGGGLEGRTRPEATIEKTEGA